MKNRIKLTNGPNPASARKCWNVITGAGSDSAEITLYGDVCSQQPTDWWTGEPAPGLYITPEGFLDDLAQIKDKSEIVVKINSGGGDLYTGIAIHNALKSLKGHKRRQRDRLCRRRSSGSRRKYDHDPRRRRLRGRLYDRRGRQENRKKSRGGKQRNRADLPRKDGARNRIPPLYDESGNVDGRQGCRRQEIRGYFAFGRGPEYEPERRQEGASRCGRSPRRESLPQHTGDDPGQTRCFCRIGSSK